MPRGLSPGFPPKEKAVYRFVESKLVYLIACVSFVSAISVSLLTDGNIPVFGGGLLPESTSILVAQGPVPPPSPDDPWVTLAQGPVPPPSPDDPWVTLAQGPVPPPSPDDPWICAA